MGNTRRDLPHAIHIGFSKCASTYVRALLRGDPGVFLVFKSGYFTPFLNRDMDFAAYQALFQAGRDKVCVESDEHLTLPGYHPEIGVRTTTIREFEEVAERIMRELPRVKLLMIIRNQASLIVSRYSEYLISGGSLGFRRFVDTLMGDGSSPNTYFQNYYLQIIRILEARFPKPNLLVLLQEEMRADTTAVAAGISRFLGLPHPLALRKGMLSERQSLSYAGMKVLRTINRLLVRRSSVAGAPPDTHVPAFLYRNISRVVRGIDYYLLAPFSPKASRVLTGDDRHRILAHFRQDNERLQSHLGRSLDGLGYFS